MGMFNAEDHLYKENKSPFTTLSSIPVNDPLRADLSMPRVNQQGIIPATVKSRLLGEIITSTSAAQAPVASQPISILDNSTTSVLFSVTNQDNQAMVAVPEVNIYINSISDTTLWPNSSYGQANVPVTIFNDLRLSNDNTTVTRVVVGNTSGAAITVFVLCAWRVITQYASSFNQANVDTSVTSSV